MLCTNPLIKRGWKNSHQIVSINAFITQRLECVEELWQGLETVTFECFHCCHGDADFSLARAVVVMKPLPSLWFHSACECIRILRWFGERCQQTNNRAVTPSLEHTLLMSSKQITSVLFVGRFHCDANVNWQDALLDHTCRLCKK